MKTIFLALVLLSTFCSRGTAQSARFVGSGLVVQDGKYRIRLTDAIDPFPIKRNVHAVRKSNGDYFIVIGVSEWSNGHSSSHGECGSGIESSIDWLHVHEGKIVERQAGLYESCHQNRDGYSIGWKHGILQWSTQGQRTVNDGSHMTIFTVDYSWMFDPAQPEKGIHEHSEDDPIDKPMTFDVPQSLAVPH